MKMKTNRKILICRTTLKIFKYGLLWPNELDEINPGLWYYIKILTYFILTSGVTSTVFMHFIITLKSEIKMDISEDVALIVALSGLYFMFFVYVKNQSKLACLLLDLSNFEKFSVPPGFDNLNKKLSFWSKIICLYYPFFGALIYSVLKILYIPQCEANKREKGLNENCGIVIPSWTPFRINSFHVFLIVYFYTFIFSIMFIRLTLMISYNVLEIVCHITLRIRHLNDMTVNCFNYDNYHSSSRRLKQCILYHSEILNFADRLDDCFSSGMFMHLTMTGIICGCIEKQFIDGNSKAGCVAHILGWIASLLLACTAGQFLTNAVRYEIVILQIIYVVFHQGESISDAIWSSKWYQADVRLQKDILFFLIRSQKGIYLRSGSFGVASFPLFVSVLKTSYSILCMLTS